MWLRLHSSHDILKLFFTKGTFPHLFIWIQINK
uniref:Uncharacterized protein n=1 Tax=Anguilla anguilla TaxID=7936 RepID=A0A0E9XLI5_ANGAN